MNHILLQFVADDELNINMNMNIIRNIVDNVIQPLPENNLHARQRQAAKVRNAEYFELTIPMYTDDQFGEHFRMSRITFEVRIISSLILYIYMYYIYIKLRDIIYLYIKYKYYV